MKKFNFRSVGEAKGVMKALSFVAFFAFFLLSFSVGVNAQTNLSKTDQLDPKHPVSVMAESIGVTVAPLSSWDLNKVIPTITQKLAGLNKNSTDPVVQLKVVYFTTLLEDITRFSISPEISSVQRLVEAGNKINNPAITTAVLKSTYTAATNTF